MQVQSSRSTGRTFLIMETFDLFTPEMLSDPTCSAVGSCARTSATQASAPESTASSQDYGASTPELLASYDHATSSWKTSQLCFGRGLERVLGDLAALGFDAEWHCIPACAVGAPHRRDRLWIVADAFSVDSGRVDRNVDRAKGAREGEGPQRQRLRGAAGHGGAVVADADEPRLERRLRKGMRERPCECFARQGRTRDVAASIAQHGVDVTWRWEPCGACWQLEPNVGRVANGISARVDRLKALGNGQVSGVAALAWTILMERINDRT